MTPTRRFLTFLLAFGLIGLAGACGDDEPASKSSSGKTTTTKADSTDEEADDTPSTGNFKEDFVAMLMGEEENFITQEQAECVADSLDENLSDEGKQKTLAEESDIEDMSADDQDASIASFDDCIPIEDLAAAFSGEAGSDATEEQKECVSSALLEKYDSSGDLMREVLGAQTEDDFANSEFGKIFTNCVLGDGGLEATLKDAMLEQGMTEEQATCVAASVSGSVTAEELVQGESSPAVQSAIATATQECMVGG